MSSKENIPAIDNIAASNSEFIRKIDAPTITEIPLPICYFSSQGEILLTNPACKNYFSKEEPNSPNKMADYLSADDFQRIKKGIAQLTPESPVFYSGEDLISCKNGNWCQWVLKGFFDQKGQVLGYGAFGFDISLQKTQLDLMAQKYDTASRLAYRDGLTRVYNRAFFNEELARLNRQKTEPLKSGIVDKRRKRKETIFIVDVDNLKQANDNFGHTAGDHLLKSVARIISNSLRPGDVVARVGGDEFAFLVFTDNPNTLNEIKDRIEQNRIRRNDLNARACARLGIPSIPTSFSIGCATYNPNLDTNLLDTYKRADSLMYDEKKQRKVGRVDLPKL